MITKPTVFVLGAGASKQFGYPLGSGLVDIILNNFSLSNSKNSVSGKDNPIEIFLGLGFSENDIDSFRYELSYAATPSIDAFLEHRQEEERLLGRLAIAYALIPFEQTQLLFTKDSWYYNLLNKINPALDNLEKNRISFITFNYDRSLEHFLMMALTNRFKKSENQVNEKLKKIPIVHLYGKLGNLPWESNKPEEFSRDYHPICTPDLIRKSSKSLKIIHDKFNPEDADFKLAKQLLAAAKKIYFLGFGYHTDNLERLRIKSLSNSPSNLYLSDINSPTPRTSRIIEGTSFKLPQNLIENIPRLYKIKLPNNTWDINEFIEQRIRFD